MPSDKEFSDTASYTDQDSDYSSNSQNPSSDLDTDSDSGSSSISSSSAYASTSGSVHSYQDQDDHDVASDAPFAQTYPKKNYDSSTVDNVELLDLPHIADPKFQQVVQLTKQIQHDKSKQHSLTAATTVTTNNELIHKLNANASSTSNTSSQDIIKAGFRAMYMEAVTSAFGDELNHLRHMDQFDSSKLELLVSSLQSGVNIFDSSEIKMFPEN